MGGDLEVRYWRDGSQLEAQLAASMKKHLKLTDDKKAYIPFNASLGLAEDSKNNNPLLAERWQILSPVRNHEFGTTEINRKIQAKYRGGMLNYSKGRGGVKPFGEQEIVFSDKVMQAVNRRKTSYPKGEGLDYVANGEIGLVVSTSKGNGRADSMKVQFSTQPLSSYYYPRPSVEGELELAYALTVHKSQGSDFDIVFLILPKNAIDAFTGVAVHRADPLPAEDGSADRAGHDDSGERSAARSVPTRCCGTRTCSCWLSGPNRWTATTPNT